MALSKDTELDQFRIKTEPVYKNKKGAVQRTIPIHSISRDGIFEIEKAKEGVEHVFDKAYIFSDVNYSTKNEYEQESFFETWCGVLNALNASFKIVVMNTKRNMAEFDDNTRLYGHGDEAYEEVAASMNKIVHDKTVVGTAGIDQQKIIVICCRRADYKSARAYFRTLEATLEVNFKTIGSSLRPLDAEERIKLLHSFYRMGREESFNFKFDRYGKMPGKDWVNSFTNLRIKEEDTFMAFEDRYVSALYVKEYPTEGVNDAFLMKLASLPIHSVVTVDCAPIPKSAAVKRLEDIYDDLKDSEARTLETYKKNGHYDASVPRHLQKEIDEIDQALDLVQDTDEKVAFCAVYILVSAPDKETLERYIMSVKTVGKEVSFEIEEYYMWQLAAMNTALPTGARETNKMRIMFTQPLAAVCLPFNVQEIYMPGGTYYGLNQVSKNVVIADRTKLAVPHGFITGKSGSGKSVAAKLSILQILLKNPKDEVIIIDPMSEYRYLIESMRGQYLDIAGSSSDHLNPLSTETREYFSSELDFIRDKATLMLAICEQVVGGITAGQKSVIDRSVRLLYEDFLSRKKDKEPVMADLVEVMKAQPEDEIRDVYLALEIFTTGSLSVFSHKSNVNLKKRLIGFGMSSMDNDLAPVGMIIMLETIRARVMRNAMKYKRTWIFIDECHRMFERGFTKMFAVKAWQEFRKLGGVNTGITQNIAALIADPEIEKMLSNSAFVLLLEQGDFDREVVARDLGVDETMLKYVSNNPPGTGILKFGGKVVPFDIRIPEGNIVYDICNTDFDPDKRKISVSEKKANRAYDEIIKAAEESEVV